MSTVTSILVQGKSSTYSVTLGDSPRCDCADFRYRGIDVDGQPTGHKCRHIRQLMDTPKGGARGFLEAPIVSVAACNSAPTTPDPVKPAKERETRPDGRLVPMAGDDVYQVVPGPFGTPAAIHGTVYRSRGKDRVRVTGTASIMGQGTAGKTYPMTLAWTVQGDPLIKAREDARRKADQDRIDAAKRETEERDRACLASYDQAIASGHRPFSAELVKPGDVVVQHFGKATRYLVTSTEYGFPAGHAVGDPLPEGQSPMTFGREDTMTIEPDSTPEPFLGAEPRAIFSEPAPISGGSPVAAEPTVAIDLDDFYPAFCKGYLEIAPHATEERLRDSYDRLRARRAESLARATERAEEGATASGNQPALAPIAGGSPEPTPAYRVERFKGGFEMIPLGAPTTDDDDRTPDAFLEDDADGRPTQQEARVDPRGAGRAAQEDGGVGGLRKDVVVGHGREGIRDGRAEVERPGSNDPGEGVRDDGRPGDHADSRQAMAQRVVGGALRDGDHGLCSRHHGLGLRPVRGRLPRQLSGGVGGDNRRGVGGPEGGRDEDGGRPLRDVTTQCRWCGRPGPVDAAWELCPTCMAALPRPEEDAMTPDPRPAFLGATPSPHFSGVMATMGIMPVCGGAPEESIAAEAIAALRLLLQSVEADEVGVPSFVAIKAAQEVIAKAGETDEGPQSEADRLRGIAGIAAEETLKAGKAILDDPSIPEAARVHHFNTLVNVINGLAYAAGINVPISAGDIVDLDLPPICGGAPEEPSPAPWSRDDLDPTGNMYSIKDRNGYDVVWPHRDGQLMVKPADLALILAAPDLLDALRKFVEWYDDLDPSVIWGAPERAAREAIAKATNPDGA